MTWFLTVLCVLVLALLVMVSGVVPRSGVISGFELRRRKEAGDASAQAQLRREGLLGDVQSLQRTAVALLLVVFVALSVTAFGWFLGILFAVLVALEYGAIGRSKAIQQPSQRLYEKYEKTVLEYIERFQGIMRVIRSVSPPEVREPKLESREELEHLVSQSGSLLTADEKKLIIHGLQFDGRKVSEVMTPRGVIDSIGKKELLGPLVLDSLHKTGHSRFPVTDGDIDHIVGILHVQDLMVLDGKQRSEAVEKAMESRVFYVREDQTLKTALAAFLKTRHHLFVVVNEFRETVGLLSLEDVIEALLGQKIVDEFDAHEDLRAVAARNPRANNEPQKHTDI